MFKKLVVVLSLLTIAACAENPLEEIAQAPKESTDNYYTITSSRSNEYFYYNKISDDGETLEKTMRPKFHGTQESQVAAMNEAQRRYDSPLNKRFRSPNWVDMSKPEVIIDVNPVVVEKIHPDWKTEYDGEVSKGETLDSEITLLERKLPRTCMVYSVNYQVTVPHGSIVELFQNSSEPVGTSCQSSQRQCMFGRMEGGLKGYLQRSCTVGTATTVGTIMQPTRTIKPQRVQSAETVSRTTGNVSCPNIMSYTDINRSVYPDKVRSCESVCFNYSGYFGMLLPENNLSLITEVSPQMRENCFRCEQASYPAECSYHFETYHIHGFEHEYDVKDTFDNPFEME